MRKDQICRSIVFLADGDLQKIKNEILPMVNDDPREVLEWAEMKAGGPQHYFNIPFPEIDTFFNNLYKDMDDEPPPEI